MSRERRSATRISRGSVRLIGSPLYAFARHRGRPSHDAQEWLGDHSPTSSDDTLDFEREWARTAIRTSIAQLRSRPERQWSRSTNFRSLPAFLPLKAALGWTLPRSLKNSQSPPKLVTKRSNGSVGTFVKPSKGSSPAPSRIQTRNQSGKRWGSSSGPSFEKLQDGHESRISIRP